MTSLLRFWSLSGRLAQNWARRRKHGQPRDILVHGVIVWGVSNAVLATFLSPLFVGDRAFLSQLSINLVAFQIAGGFFFGPLTWAIFGRPYGCRLQEAGRGQSHAD